MKKIDQLIGEATKAKDQIEQKQDDKKAVNSYLTGYVKKGQDIFKRIVGQNKDYYDLLSKQTKQINTTFQET